MSTARERFMNATKLVRAGRTTQSLVKSTTARDRFMNATRLVKSERPQTVLSGKPEDRGSNSLSLSSAPQSPPASSYLTGGSYTPATPYAAGAQAGLVKTPERKEKLNDSTSVRVPASTYLTGGSYTPAAPYAAGLQAGPFKAMEKEKKQKPAPVVRAPAWMELMDLSTDEMKRQHTAKKDERNAVREQVQAKEREVTGAHSSYAASAGLYKPREENPVSSSTAAASGGWVSQGDRELAALKLEEGRKQHEVSDLATAHYHRENLEQLARLETDSFDKARYTLAKELTADLDSLDKALVNPTGYNGQDTRFNSAGAALLEKYESSDLRALKKFLTAEKARLVELLGDKGYDFEAMAGYDRMLEQQESYLRTQERMTKEAEEHPVWSSGLSVILSPFRSSDGIRTWGNGIGHSNADDLGSYVPMNVYDMYATNMVQTIRETVSEQIKDNTNWELFGQNVATFLYNTGMNIAESAFQKAAFGDVASVLLMGSSSAAKTTKRVIEQGGSNEQAFWLGLSAGAAEVVFENINLDNLPKIKNARNWEETLKAVSAQAGVPISKGMLTKLSNILADTMARGDRSEWAAAEKEYEAQGLSRNEAWLQATLDNMLQMGKAGIKNLVLSGLK